LQKTIAQYGAWLGYWDTSAHLTDGGCEYVFGASTRLANHNDWLVALKLVDRLLRAGDMPWAAIADRGFTSGEGGPTAWTLAPWQPRGSSAIGRGHRDFGAVPAPGSSHRQGMARVPPSCGPPPQGCLVLPSGVYVPFLPRRLWFIERPGPKAPVDKKAAYRQAIEEREIYAFGPHGRPTPKQVRLSSPVLRRKRTNALGCRKVPGSMRRRDPRLAACDGNHGDDEACCIKTATLKAEELPSIFQYPFWGTPEWEEKYAKRTNVERGFSTFKNPDVIGMTKGQFHYRHIPNLSLLVTFMWGAHNLHIWLKRERDAAKAAAAALKKHRLRPRRSAQVAVVLNPGSTPVEEPALAEDSRAP
jgi:hypothetical protein